MRRYILLIAALIALMIPGALAQTAELPSQAGLDAASALTAMHEAVMRDVLGSEYRFSQPAGGDSIFVLYTDDESKNYLMVSLTAEGRADMAVIQCYSLAEFRQNGLDSLTALALPFIPEPNRGSFENWREETAESIFSALVDGVNMDLTYYTGEYVACAMSLAHQPGSAHETLFTAVISWHAPLSAEDITLIMETEDDGETEADGQ